MRRRFAALWLLAASAASGAEADYTDAMSREHAGDRPDPSPAALAAPTLPVAAAEVAYGTVAGAPVTGWLARPRDAGEIRGALIVIHEWWGLNDNIRSMAEQLAGEGYAALAVDLYGGRRATTPEAARALMQAAMADRAAAQDNLRSAYRYLTAELGAAQVASIGWCFGGAWSLNTALMYPRDLDAAVIYYGHLVTDPETLAPLEVPLLGIFGALDQGIPLASVQAFEDVLASQDKDARYMRLEDSLLFIGLSVPPTPSARLG